MSRRTSDTPPANKPSALDKNCAQIFARGPALTRDIFERMQKDRRHIMGYEIETKQLWLLSGLLLLFLLSLTGMIAMWFTETFDNVVFSNLAIVPNSQSYEMWKKPIPKPYMKVYIFNYTNVQSFQNGDDKKLNVQELGPYTYELTLERVNIKYNGTKITYQEQKLYKYMAELSKGRKQNDRVVVPNLPLLTAAALNQHAPFFTRVGLSGLLNGVDAKPFITIPAHRFIMGYNDNLYDLAKGFMKLQNKKVTDKFGLLAAQAGVIDDVITINTGEKDINKVTFIDKMNGEASLSHWSTAECNDFSKSTDGALFPPKLIRNKRPISFYSKDFCRTLPLIYEKQVKILNGKIPAYRYILPDSVFDTPERTPSNQCYCDMDLGACPPQGVYNVTQCANGAPVFMSYPHFYNADPILKRSVSGLKSNPEYRTYVDLHPTLGFTMAMKSRVQMNIQVKKAFGISQVNMFEDESMLPIAWFETVLEDKSLPDDMVGIIFQTTFTLKGLEIGLKYGTLLTMGVTLFGILLLLKNRWANRIKINSIIPLQTNEESV